MLNLDIEKGAGALNPPQPNMAHTENRDSFLPTYEEHLNENLRNFNAQEAQVGIQKFDHIQDAPQRGRRGWLKREYIILAIVLLIIFALALPIGVIYILRSGDSEHKVLAPSTSTSLEQGTETLVKTITMQTREATSSPSRASLTASMVPSTIYVTITPTPSIDIPIVTLTTTLPTPKVSLLTITPEAETETKTKTEKMTETKETEQQTSTVTNTRTITESPTPTDTVTSMSTILLSTSETSKETVPETTTVLSVTTLSPTPSPTPIPATTTRAGTTIIPVTPSSVSSTSTSSIQFIQPDPFRLLCGAPGAACP